MKYSKYILKLLFYLYIIYKLVIADSITFQKVFIFLLIVAVNIYKDKVNNNLFAILASIVLAAIGFYFDRVFGILFLIGAFDLIQYEAYIFFTALVIGEFYLTFTYNFQDILILFTLLCGLFGYIINNFEKKEAKNLKLIDNERRLRYELEETKIKLINSSKETVYLAELKERNRIARDIHDSVGHTLSGILIQLQAAEKLQDKDSTKSKEIIKNCTAYLRDAVDVLRNTVHNIMPKTNINEEYVHNVIKNFSFCDIDYKFTGDFSRVPTEILEALAVNIREALSNASKYSNAEKVYITIDINDVYVRVHIKDNGEGAKKIHEGLGLSGMKERVYKLRGTISISGDHGFTIVFIIPLEKGSGIFENINS